VFFVCVVVYGVLFVGLGYCCDGCDSFGVFWRVVFSCDVLILWFVLVECFLCGLGFVVVG
jgi:hypothetical protein